MHLLWICLQVNVTETQEKPTLVQVMAWCRQATSHYLSQCRRRSMLPYGVTRPQWVNAWLKLIKSSGLACAKPPLRPYVQKCKQWIASVLFFCYFLHANSLWNPDWGESAQYYNQHCFNQGARHVAPKATTGHTQQKQTIFNIFCTAMKMHMFTNDKLSFQLI